MLFSLLKYHLDLDKSDTPQKVSRSLYGFTTSVSHGVENYLPRLWGTGISDAIFRHTITNNFLLSFPKSPIIAHHHLE